VRGEPPIRVVIVGAGIVGASIAYHLARRGAKVTVCEKERPAAGATSKSFAWINSTFAKEPRGYYELNLAGMAAWRRLESDLQGDLPVQWGGSLEWYPPGAEAERLRADLRRHQSWGYAARAVDEAEVRRLLPGVVPGPVAAAAWSEEEGSVDPVQAVSVLLAHAQKLGARVLHPCAVIGLDLTGGRVTAVRTDAGRLDNDVLVVAAGVGSPTAAALAGVRVPLKDSPGVLAHTAPLAHALDRVVLAPGAHVVQRASGRVVTGSSFGGSPLTSGGEAEGRGLLREAARFLPFLEGAPLAETTVGYRVMPEDELPILGFAPGRPNLYLAAMHSGVTLAPLVGRHAATEILDGVLVEALAPYRLARFD
jgi:glycine/D-amino acid oxidase-like deaminating enzyme